MAPCDGREKAWRSQGERVLPAAWFSMTGLLVVTDAPNSCGKNLEDEGINTNGPHDRTPVGHYVSVNQTPPGGSSDFTGVP